MISLKSIFLCALICFFVWYILRARELKDLAIIASSRYCQSLDLKLLDQTVVLSKIRIAQSQNGRRCMVREYRFDFTSTGEDRYAGTIRLAGKKVDEIKLAPHRVD